MCWGATPTRRSHSTGHCSISPAFLRPTGCPIAFGPIMGFHSPRTPWRGFRNCLYGSSSWAFFPSPSSQGSRNKMGGTAAWPPPPRRGPPHYRVRRVSRDGAIRVLRNQIFVSNTLHEDYVGHEEVGDGVYDLFFCFYQIGRYQLRTNKIQDIVSRVGVSRRQVDLASRVLPMSLE